MSRPPLASPHIGTLEPYLSARRIGGAGDLWLNANESPFPRQPMAMDVSQYHRYPDTGPDAVQAAYADYAGVAPEQVLALRGADEVIDLLVRAYCRAGEDRILVCGPTYGMYEVCAQIQNAGIVDVPLRDDHRLDVPAICARDDVRLVFLCNPNNPTGNAFAPQDLLAIVEHFADRALVVVDEAYVEFAPRRSLVPYLGRYPQLAIARTLSKAFGLAGVHVGFLLAGAAIMSVIRRVAAPYPLADPCAQIAVQALRPEGIALMRREVAAIAAVREDFVAALRELDAVVAAHDSVTNFVMVQFADAEAAWVALVAAGIVARRSAHPRLRDMIRFSIGTGADMARVIEALRPLRA